MRYRNRGEAGRRLALVLDAFEERLDVTVLGLPRGGVPVAYEVARALHVELDIVAVRKLGLPGQPEFAMGAVALGGIVVLDEDLIATMGVTPAALERVIAVEQAEVARRERLYRGSRPPLNVRDRTLILVDDGLATGASVQAAVIALRRGKPASIVVASPVGSSEACHAIAACTDGCLCPEMPEPFYTVGLWYEDFSDTRDAEVTELLGRAWEKAPTRARVIPDRRGHESIAG
jgi:putative phosphoribosyl transferase